MINLEESLRREILRRIETGAYHCTNVVDCNTENTWAACNAPCPNLMMKPRFYRHG